jgi:hypothetical protein
MRRNSGVAMYSVQGQIDYVDRGKIVKYEVDTTIEGNSFRDVFHYLIDIANRLGGWISDSQIRSINKTTGELRLLPPPEEKSCPLKDLPKVKIVRLPELALSKPYTYKEDSNDTTT